MRRFFSRKPSSSPNAQVPYPEARLKDLIFFVTDRCNMRCDHCMFWRRVDSPGPELGCDEIEKTAQSVPPLRTAALTGGEPFLRQDLWEIVRTFFQRNRTHHVQVDTNGLLLDRMLEVIDRFADLSPGRYLTYQVSLDGLSETHDRLRRTPGSFERVLSSLKACREVQSKVPYFRVVVLTNVNRENVNEIEPLAGLLSGMQIPHVYDFVRGAGFSAWDVPKDIQIEDDPRDCALPSLEELKDLMERIAGIEKREGGEFGQWITQLRYQIDLYQGGRPPFPCLSAGRTAGVVYSDGSVTACEFTQPFARLADYDFDLGRLWAGPEAGGRRSQITHCRCAHSCFLLTSHQEWLELTGQAPTFDPTASKV
ncbi:MAG: radical SAM protein [bacterium]